MCIFDSWRSIEDLLEKADARLFALGVCKTLLIAFVLFHLVTINLISSF